ncbi:MAG: hypothetical protein RBS19_01085 [Bacteroidales bacterium]|nr:hypothetical protein [Bacteroidales bacterium]MDY0215522.1 hypothetical protein [Bacteroidales bacterium]
MKKISKILAIAFLFASFGIVFNSCKDEVDDVKSLAALRNVSLSYDSLQLNVGLPEGSLNGQSFQELREENEALFSDLSNYKIGLTTFLKADNQKDKAQNAAFQGLILNTIMDNMGNSPFQIISGPFEVGKNEIKPFIAEGNINLLTHKYVGKYIFKQIVDGENLATTLAPILNYKIGDKQGGLNLPQMNQSIPTRGSDELKSFLNGFISSDLMN